LRRWKARCALRRPIPREAIEDYNLTRWFTFEHLEPWLADFYVAEEL
jgi:hypothetical protein